MGSQTPKPEQVVAGLQKPGTSLQLCGKLAKRSQNINDSN